MISICIIAKNEEKNIERCLSSFADTGFELVVVDTGSTDRTKEIAKKYTDHIYDFEWCNDFAAARNYSISKASNTYIMIIDCDEYLESMDIGLLQSLLRLHKGKVGRIQINNIITKNGIKQENKEWVSRIFSKEECIFEGRIHEQIVTISGEPRATYQTPVVIGHTGYDLSEEDAKRKAERNINMLLKELEVLQAQKEQEGDIPYVLYQLGKSYFMTQDYEQAVEYFSQGLSYDLNPKLEYVIEMVETYGYALINSQRAKEALFFENIYDEFGNSADFKFLMGLIYMNNSLFERAVEEFLKATKYSDCKTVGVNSYSAFYNIGVIYECLGYKMEAAEYYEKCGEFQPALQHLKLI